MSDQSQTLDENIFDYPLFFIDTEILCTKGNNWTDVGVIKVSYIWSDNKNVLSKAKLAVSPRTTRSDLMYN